MQKDEDDPFVQAIARGEIMDSEVIKSLQKEKQEVLIGDISKGQERLRVGIKKFKRAAKDWAWNSTN